jgi:TetR/AcrR family transcriptional repressor of uid operon
VPRVSAARLEARREQILEAAVACFARRGFHETTMADVAREAGITAGAIYRYFPSKEDVVEASAEAQDRARAERFRVAQEKGDQQGHNLRVLDEVLDLYLARAARPDPVVRLRVQLFGEALHNRRVRDVFRKRWDEILTRMAEIVRRAQAQGEIDPTLDPGAVAGLLLAAADGLAVHKSVDPDVDVRQYAQVLKALYRSGSRRDSVPASDGKR